MKFNIFIPLQSRFSAALATTTTTASFRYPPVGRRTSPVSRSTIRAIGPDSSTQGPLIHSTKPKTRPGPRWRSRRGRRCIQNIVMKANSESYPFVLYASCLAITPATAFAAAAVVLLIVLGSSALGTLLYRIWRNFVAMLTRRGQVSGGMMTWSKYNGTRLAGRRRRRELNRTVGGEIGGAWWRLDIEDLVPVDFPDSETFWFSVAVVLAWGIICRLSAYMRKLRSKNEINFNNK